MSGPGSDQEPPVIDRVLTPQAQRALAEAAARRASQAPRAPDGEVGGPLGPDPTRFGDWERKGIAVDF